MVTAIFRQSSRTSCGKRRFYERQQAFVSARTAPLDEQVEAKTERCKQKTQHRAAFSVPVMSEAGECIGSLACHYEETHSPSREEIERNTIWAGMIAHVISEHTAAGLNKTSIAEPGLSPVPKLRCAS
jgi:hypothetical protein